MRKGQAQIFSEFLSFALGLVVMMSIAFIFSSYLAPELVGEATNEHLNNLLEQVQTAASQLDYYSDYFSSRTQTLKLNVPTKLVKRTYEVYEYNGKLCASVSGTEYLKCVNTDYNIEGSFVSGTKMLITIDKDKEGIITISSD